MKLVDEFKALSDKTRLRIIALLLDGDLCVCEIVDVLGMTQSRISRHLGILKQVRLIEEERKGKWVVYKITDQGDSIFSYIQAGMKSDPVYAADIAKINKTLNKKLCPNK